MFTFDILILLLFPPMFYPLAQINNKDAKNKPADGFKTSSNQNTHLRNPAPQFEAHQYCQCVLSGASLPYEQVNVELEAGKTRKIPHCINLE